MPKLRVLVTLTSEAIVDVPDDAANVDEFLREQVSLGWGEALVERIVHEDASVAFYPVEAVAEAPVDTEAMGATADDLAATSDEVERALALAEASIVVSPQEAPEERGLELVEAAVPSDEALEVSAAPVVPEASDLAPRELTHDDVLGLFTDPLYHDMIRSAVRDRAVAMLETVVAEVVSELEPLMRRQTERRKPSGA
jgi:hypothetical protein